MRSTPITVGREETVLALFAKPKQRAISINKKVINLRRYRKNKTTVLIYNEGKQNLVLDGTSLIGWNGKMLLKNVGTVEGLKARFKHQLYFLQETPLIRLRQGIVSYVEHNSHAFLLGLALGCTGCPMAIVVPEDNDELLAAIPFEKIAPVNVNQLREAAIA